MVVYKKENFNEKKNALYAVVGRSLFIYNCLLSNNPLFTY